MQVKIHTEEELSSFLCAHGDPVSVLNTLHGIASFNNTNANTNTITNKKYR